MQSQWWFLTNSADMKQAMLWGKIFKNNNNQGSRKCCSRELDLETDICFFKGEPGRPKARDTLERRPDVCFPLQVVLKPQIHFHLITRNWMGACLLVECFHARLLSWIWHSLICFVYQVLGVCVFEWEYLSSIDEVLFITLNEMRALKHQHFKSGLSAAHGRWPYSLTGKKCHESYSGNVLLLFWPPLCSLSLFFSLI